jgi:hypothetical protein
MRLMYGNVKECGSISQSLFLLALSVEHSIEVDSERARNGHVQCTPAMDGDIWTGFRADGKEECGRVRPRLEW